MPDKLSYVYDAASALFIGHRDEQQDAVSKDFVSAAGLGFAVLADGMGGHAAGDVASRIVVNEVFRRIKALAAHPLTLEDDLEHALLEALSDANACLETVAKTRPELEGMGSTLIAPVVTENRLYWISVGDSPLYLLRGSQLYRLNENHSVAGVLDILVSEGEIEANVARQHPERHLLTSVMNGSSIEHIDCRQTPFVLEAGDMVIAASDGLQSIGDTDIARIAYDMRDSTAQKITDTLVQAVKDHNDPDQDNVSMCVFKVLTKSVSQASDVEDIAVVPGFAKPADNDTSEPDTSIMNVLYRRANGGRS